MRAAVYHRYRRTIRGRRRGAGHPVPGPGEVLVRVAASVVSTSRRRDALGQALRGPAVRGTFRPRLRVLGSEFTGVVAAVGEGRRCGSASATRCGASPAPACAPTPSTSSCLRTASSSRCPRASTPSMPRRSSMRRRCRSSTTPRNSSRGRRSSSTAPRAPSAPRRSSSRCTGGPSSRRSAAPSAPPLVRELGAHEVLDYRAGDVVATLRAAGTNVRRRVRRVRQPRLPTRA